MKRLPLHIEELECRITPVAGLLGEYYNTIDLQQLASTRVDATVNFTEADWGNGPPGTGVVADDNWSERWTGFVSTPTAGNWTFYTNSNDGVRLWIDNNLVINNWNQHTATENSATLNLSAGWHALRLEHYQQDGTVVIQLSFAGPGQAKTIIPTSSLSTVLPATGLPTANAGPDKTVTLPANSVTLNGSGTDSNGTITSYQWQKLSGPSASLSGVNSANLTAGNLQQGVYTFELTVTDNDGNTATDTAIVNVVSPTGNGVISGELKEWHKITIDFQGPVTSETAATNPFTNYRLDVTFTHQGTGATYVVPGYFAADGNAANSSASSGNIWRVHFAPSQTGTWTYAASFRAGVNVAVASNPLAGSSAGFFDGATGSFSVAATNKTGIDLRGKGLLEYVGGHYLQFAGTGEYFLKQGADSPENFLAYDDFDNTPNYGGLLKSWSPHAGDWLAGDPSWAGGKGTEIIGAINYLASEGLNAFSFIPMNIGGDDKNVFPYISDSSGGDRLRMDVSKLAQWEIVFEHGDRMGMFLHFKTQETENELLLDGGNMGPERTLYYRELIARFSHHLALNWNLGEEINNATTAQKQAWAQYFHDNDPYQHHIVIHNGSNHYDLLGNASELTGFSLQTNNANFSEVHSSVLNYLTRSVTAGKPWAVAVDEPGDAQHALRPDNDAGTSHEDGRKNALWGTFMAGGWGNEWYFGYDHAQSDLTLNDFRSRDNWWDYARYALQFFNDNSIPFWEMHNDNAISSAANDYGFIKPGEVYTVYLKNGGTTNLNLSGVSGTFEVKWFDPRNGGALQNGTVTQVNGGSTVSLGQAPNSTSQDWAILVRRVGGPVNPPAAPGSLAASAVSSSQINLTWSDNSSNETGFEIQRATDSGFSQNLVTANVGSNVVSLQATGLSASTTYYFRVRAVNAGGASAWSGAASATTQAAAGQQPFLGAPFSVGSTIQAEDFDTGGAGIAYHDTTAGNSGNSTYRAGESVDIQTTTDSGGGLNVGWTKAGEWLEYTVAIASAGTYQLEARVASNGAGGVFHAEFNGVNQTGAMAIASTGGWQNWQTLTSSTFTLSAGTQVLRIALDSNGSTSYVGNFNWFRIVAVQLPPAAPSGLSAGAISTSQINLAWSDNASNETGFEIQRATNSTFTQNVATSTAAANAASLAVTGLTASTTYFFRVRSINAAGVSAWSNTASATTQTASTAGAVVSFTLVNADTDQDIGTLTNGMVINLAALATRNLSIRANVNGTVESVRLVLDGGVIAVTENVAPYSLTGDTNGNYNPWTPPVGSHTLTATPYTLDNLGGQQGTALTITFQVIDDANALVDAAFILMMEE